MEPSNKANAVCVQLVRPCNSSERVPDSFFFHKMERVINHPLLLGLPYLSIKPKTQSPSRSSKTIPYQAMHTYLPYIRDYLPPPLKTSRVTWQANMDPDFWIQIYEMIHIFWWHDTGSFMYFIKTILVGHVINQSSNIYNGRHACLTKENILGNKVRWNY